MLSDKDIFARWAPQDRYWSAWAKPNLFLSLTADPALVYQNASAELSADQLPKSSARIALIIELSGARTVQLGLIAAGAGFQPVPLFNCCTGLMEQVPTMQLRVELACGASVLASQPLAADAPPAFLIDSNRLEGKWKPEPGDFDNRWLVFPQDFPSSRCLKSHGIDGVVWITETNGALSSDLAHVLHGWQEGGIQIYALRWGMIPAEPKLLRVSRPASYGSLWYRALSILGLRRNSAGGFGSTIPDSADLSGLG